MSYIIVFLAQYLYVFNIALAGMVLVTCKNKRLLSLVSLLSLSLAFVISRILSKLIYSPRPFTVENVKPLFPHAANNGFPSDHTLLAMTISALVFTVNKKLGLILFLFTLLIGISRVVAKIHSPIDIFGSIVIAVFSVFVADILVKRISLH